MPLSARFGWVLAAILMMSSGPGAQAGGVSARGPSVKLLSFNVWGLPKIAGGKAYWRFAEIGKRIRDYDIVSIQEAWDTATEDIPNLASFPWVVRGQDIHKTPGGSGIMILSRYPVIETGALVYGECAGTDCLAKKGAVRVRVKLPGRKILDVYDTHMNAWLNVGVDIGSSVRAKQIHELSSWIERESAGVPFVVLCDSNSVDESDNYYQMQREFGALDVFRALHPLGTPGYEGYSWDPRSNTWITGIVRTVAKPMRIDYVWAGNGFAPQDFLDSKLVFTEPVAQGKHLSDHFGLSSLIRVP